VRQRRRIFAETGFAVAPGIGCWLVALFILLVVEFTHGMLNEHDYLCGLMASFVVLEIGNFVLFFGTQAFSACRFPTSAT